jgi:hypothetical protein
MIGITLLWIFIFALILYLTKNSKDKIIKFGKEDKNFKKRDFFEEYYDKNFTFYEKKIIYDKFSNRCFKCGSRKNLTIDHHMPLSMGYGLEEKNAVVLCKKCNNKKSNRLPQYFYKEKELYELWEKYGIVTDYNIMSINKENIEKEYEKMNKIYSGEVRVTFDYMGKKVEGLLLGIVSPNEVEFNRKREKYLEVVEGNEVNLYKMVNVKRLYIKGEKENARL